MFRSIFKGQTAARSDEDSRKTEFFLHAREDLAPVNDLRGLLLAVLSEHWGIETERLRREVFPGMEKKLSLPTVLV
ncbi:MAG: hypothetical protein EBW20_08275 [Betaproteobacteria bacterium]|nr:hypothetical protein [Betaproteobacteria bacterium]